jgi:3',5'-cyclic-AMP phosphodiesterase
VALGRIHAFLISVALTACTDVTGDRTRRDFAETGRADLGDIQASIDQGVAVDIDASRPFVRFRANAPDVKLTFISSAATERTVEVELTNVFEASDLSVPSELIDHNTFAFSVEVPAGGIRRVSIGRTGADTATRFRFAWVGDVQGGNGPFKRLRQSINDDPSIEFTVFAGDITVLGNQKEIDAFVAIANELEQPWYCALGNHEVMFGQPLAFQHTVGRLNARFDYKGARFVIIDTSSATVSPEVYEFIETAMKAEGPATRIVAMHMPPLDPEGLRDGAFSDRTEAARLLAILAKGGTDLILAGHMHTLRVTSQAGIETWISGNGGVSRGSRFELSDIHYLAITVDPDREAITVEPIF